MSVAFMHVRDHWTQSAPPSAGGRVVLSEMPRGDSPVVVATRCLNYVIDGTEQYEVNGRVTSVEAGQFLFIDAGISARAILPRDAVTRGLCIYLPSDAPLSPAAQSAELAETIRFSAADTGFGRALQRAGLWLARDPARGPDCAATIVRYAAAEFDRLSSDLALRLMRIEAAKPGTRRDLLRRLERVRSYLHDHPDRPVPLAELARVAALSPFHLARTFRAAFELPPAEYHRRYRMDRAAAELRRGGLSITEAAERFGFHGSSSFARSFRRTTGINPSAARTGGG